MRITVCEMMERMFFITTADENEDLISRPDELLGATSSSAHGAAGT
jgi:hypothetical protein